MLEAAAQNELVVADPSPAALFLNFGESSLDFELRVFVQGIRDLILVKHQIHHAINQSFRSAGVEISFPQQDIHFDNKPIEVQILPSANYPTPPVAS